MQLKEIILLILSFVSIHCSSTKEPNSQIRRTELSGDSLEYEYTNIVFLGITYIKNFIENVSDEKAEIISNLLRKQKKLKFLAFDSCDLDLAFARIFTNGIKDSESIKRLNFRNSEIGDYGAQAIATIIKDSKKLKIIRLYGAKITKENWCLIREAGERKGVIIRADGYRSDWSYWDYCNYCSIL